MDAQVAHAEEWLHRDAIGAWDIIGRDPIGVLAPAAAALAVEATLAFGIRAYATSWLTVVELVAAAVVVRWIVQAPFRTAMIAAAARAHGLAAEATVGRVLALLGVDAIRGIASVAAAAMIGVPLGAAAVGLATRDLFLFAALIGALGAVLAALVGLMVRASFAFASPEAVVGSSGPFGAIRRGWSASGGNRLQIAALLLAGDVAVGFGGALCGAGALPGYPIGDVAVLHRWARRRGP